MKNKLLHTFANVEAIFFPVGDLAAGGTCEFSTEICREKCCAISHRKIGAAPKFKKDTYNFFIDSSAEDIAASIYKELEAPSKFTYLRPKPLLSWFASGDCPSALTNKVFTTITLLHNRGIVQNGTTRNKELWKLTNSIKDRTTRFLLTKERKFARLASNFGNGDEEGLYSLPNYPKVTIDIVNYVNHTVEIYRGCGGGYYTDHVLKNEKIKTEKYLELNCQKCVEKQVGCFINLIN